MNREEAHARLDVLLSSTVGDKATFDAFCAFIDAIGGPMRSYLIAERESAKLSVPDGATEEEHADRAAIASLLFGLTALFPRDIGRRAAFELLDATPNGDEPILFRPPPRPRGRHYSKVTQETKRFVAMTLVFNRARHGRTFNASFRALGFEGHTTKENVRSWIRDLTDRHRDLAASAAAKQIRGEGFTVNEATLVDATRMVIETDKTRVFQLANGIDPLL